MDLNLAYEYALCNAMAALSESGWYMRLALWIEPNFGLAFEPNLCKRPQRLLENALARMRVLELNKTSS